MAASSTALPTCGGQHSTAIADTTDLDPACDPMHQPLGMELSQYSRNIGESILRSPSLLAPSDADGSQGQTIEPPTLLQNFLQNALSRQNEIIVIKEEHRAVKTIDTQMGELADSIDEAMDWVPDNMDMEERLLRAATQLVLLLRDRCADEGRSDLLNAKAFTLIFQDWYRSHDDILFAYDNGSFNRAASISASALEFALDGIRLAQAMYLYLCATKDLTRDADQLLRQVSESCLAHDSNTLLEKLLTAKTSEDDATHWCQGASDLCGAMFKHLSEQKQKVIACFHLWGGSEMRHPTGGQNFIDCFYFFGNDEKDDLALEQRKIIPGIIAIARFRVR